MFRWHRGRCLSYGDGVAYWALAEMVRGRARHPGGRGCGFGSRKAARCCRRAPLRPGGAPLGRTPPRASSRARGAKRQGQGGPVRRLAALLRADVGGPPGRDVLRGHAVGGRVASRLHRVPARLVAEPRHLRSHAVAARDRRAPAELGCGPAELHLDLPGAALPAGHAASWSRGSCRASPTTCATGSSTAPRACPSTPSRRCGCSSTGACSSAKATSYRPAGPIGALDIPETLHALIAARLDGLSPGERRLLQEAAVIGKTFSKESLVGAAAASLRTTVERAARLARSQGGDLAPDRPTVARPWPVRLPPGPRPGRRLRDASQSATARTSISPSPTISFRRGAATRTRSSRSPRPITWRHTGWPRTRSDAESREGQGEGDARCGPASAPPRSPRPKAAQRYFEQALELTDDAGRARAALDERAGQMAMLCGRKSDDARAHFEAAISTLEAIGETHASARVSARLGEIDFMRGPAGAGDRADGEGIRPAGGRGARMRIW